MATDNKEQTGMVSAGQNPYALMDELDDMQTLARLDPMMAAKLTAGIRPDTLVYIVPTERGKPPIVGVSTTGAQVLMSRRGGFETLPDYRLDEIMTEIAVPVEWETVQGRYGEYEKVTRREAQPCRGIRVFVRVTDKRNDMTFIGVCEQPLSMAQKNGEVVPDPHAFVKCFNKAERNAARKHFAAFEDQVIELAKEAKEQDKVYVMGDVDDAEFEVVGQVEANIKRLETRDAEPLGSLGAAELGQYVSQRVELLVTAGVVPKADAAKLVKATGADLKREVTRRYGVQAINEAPATAKAQLMAWVLEKLPVPALPTEDQAVPEAEAESPAEPPQPLDEFPVDLDALREEVRAAAVQGMKPEAIAAEIDRCGGSLDALEALKDKWESAGLARQKTLDAEATE